MLLHPFRGNQFDNHHWLTRVKSSSSFKVAPFWSSKPAGFPVAQCQVALRHSEPPPLPSYASKVPCWKSQLAPKIHVRKMISSTGNTMKDDRSLMNFQGFCTWWDHVCHWVSVEILKPETASSLATDVCFQSKHKQLFGSKKARNQTPRWLSQETSWE